MSSDVTIYLHIGASKTGTTALQRFFEQHAAKLRKEHGILYPNFYDKDFLTDMRPGVNYWHGKYFEGTDGSKDVEIFQKCADDCRKNSLRGFIVSHEGLLNKWPDRIGLLANKVKADFKVICYVRRQDHHLESAWKQIGHKFCSAKELLHHKEGWGGWRKTNWYEQLDPWAENFGKENIIVKPYEKEQMPGGIYFDFLKAIDVQWEGKADLIRSASLNSGFSRDVMEFLYLNKEFYTGPGDQRLYIMLTQLLDSEYVKKPFDSYNLLSPLDRIELLQQFEASNQMVAREYLHREDGRLFYEPWPRADDPWEPYEGLTTEKFVPIVTNLIYGLYENQKNLERKLHLPTQTKNITEKIKVFLKKLIKR